MTTRTYSIVGMEHQHSTEIVAALQTGADVILVREPTNQYDPNAIAVWVDGKRIGYIPKAQNKVLAGFIDGTGHNVLPYGDDPNVVSMAFDTNVCQTGRKGIPAKFVRSPNSGYPLVEV